MPSLLILPGFPSTSGPGQENLGKNIDGVTLLTVTPDGTVDTPANIRTLVEAALAGTGSHSILGLWRQPSQM